MLCTVVSMYDDTSSGEYDGRDFKVTDMYVWTWLTEAGGMHSKTDI